MRGSVVAKPPVGARAGLIGVLVKPTVDARAPTTGNVPTVVPGGALVRPSTRAFDGAPKTGRLSEWRILRVSGKLLIGHDEWLGRAEQSDVGVQQYQSNGAQTVLLWSPRNPSGAGEPECRGRKGKEIDNGCICVVPLPCESDRPLPGTTFEIYGGSK